MSGTAMRCEEARIWIEKLDDGEGGRSAEARVEAHLAECPGCRDHRRLVATLRTAGRAPLALPGESYFESLPSKVMARIERESAKKNLSGRFTVRRWEWVGALAAAVVVAVVGLRILRGPMVMERAPVAAPPTTAAELEQSKDERAPDPRRMEEVPPSGQKANRGLTRVGDLEKQRAASGERAEKDQPAPGKTGQTAPLDLGESLTVAGAPAPEPEVKEMPQEVGGGPAAPASAPASGRRLASEMKSEDKVVSLQPATTAAEGSYRSTLEPRPRAAQGRADRAEDRGPENFARLLERYPEPELGAPPAGLRDAPESGSPAASIEAQARDWRDFLTLHPESRFAVTARYRLALCSIRLFELRGTEDDRKRAVEDATTYLTLAPSGQGAEKVRRGLERLQERR